MAVDAVGEEESFIEIPVFECNDKGLDIEFFSFIDDGIPQIFANEFEIDQLFVRCHDHTSIQQDHGSGQVQFRQEGVCLAETPGCGDGEDCIVAYPIPNFFAVGADRLVATQKGVVEVGEIDRFHEADLSPEAVFSSM